MKEEALLFGQRQALIGVVTWPPVLQRSPALPAVLLLNAGILHRVGPNRTYVKIARSLAALGSVVLRFDFSGIGDSVARDDTLPFDQASIQEVQEAMATLHAAAGSAQFVLMGLCSGARTSFQAAVSDPRVVGAVLINPISHLHDDRDQELGAALRNRALLHHFRRIALFSSFRAKNWPKLLTGNLNHALLGQTIRGLRLRAEPAPTEYARAQLRALSARGVHLLHIYSEGDEGLDYFRLLLGKEADAPPVELIRGANHTFTPLWSQARLVQVLVEWMQRTYGTDGRLDAHT